MEKKTNREIQLEELASQLNVALHESESLSRLGNVLWFAFGFVLATAICSAIVIW